jgi:phage baseplate assembly protein W
MVSTTGNPAVDAVIGVGISMPVEFASVKNTQLLTLASGTDIIGQSIKMILDTPLGSRVNNNEFGSNVRDLIFEPNDMILKPLLYYAIVSAIQRWEARITITTVQYATEDVGTGVPPNQINITINYIINATNQPGSYVYPFVKNAMPYSSVIQGSSNFNLTSQSMSS